jgi:hypothetical protein
MNLGLSVVIAAALIGSAIAVSHRYVIAAHPCGAAAGDCSRTWRVDQWTGQTSLCEFASDSHAAGPACVAVTQ